MVARRTDARRRRVLSEEFVPTDETSVDCHKKPMQAYSFGANRRNQPKTTDLIPKRATALSLFFLLVITCVVGLNMLAYNAASVGEVIGQSGMQSTALHGPGTLANWCCSVSLFLCAGICAQLFFLRQHKRDDYGGMYRVWLVMSLMFIVASIDCAIDLRSIAAKLFEVATHRSLIQTPWLMLTIEMIVLGIIVIRMLFEVRTSKVTLTAVLLVWCGFVGCIVLRNVQLPESLSAIDHNMAYGNCILLGCVGSLVALTIYARFVFLHAHGLIQLKVKTAKPAADSEQEQTTTARKTKTSKTRSAASANPQVAASTRKRKQTASTEAPANEPVVTEQQTKTKKAPAAKSATKPAPINPMVAKPASAKRTAAKPPAKPAQKTAPTKPAQQKTVVQQQLAAPAAKPAAKSPTAKKTAAPKTKAATAPKAAPKVATPPQATQSTASAPASTAAIDEPPETVKMSKSERRRKRKLEKRAARAKKAA